LHTGDLVRRDEGNHEVAELVTGTDIEGPVTGTARVEQGIEDAQDVTKFNADQVGGA
jgi:hypothetical protein